MIIRTCLSLSSSDNRAQEPQLGATTCWLFREAVRCNPALASKCSPDQRCSSPGQRCSSIDQRSISPKQWCSSPEQRSIVQPVDEDACPKNVCKLFDKSCIYIIKLVKKIMGRNWCEFDMPFLRHFGAKKIDMKFKSFFAPFWRKKKWKTHNTDNKNHAWSPKDGLRCTVNVL